ncbi:unnamed protein product [Gadus morhua 'NCC']
MADTPSERTNTFPRRKTRVSQPFPFLTPPTTRVPWRVWRSFASKPPGALIAQSLARGVRLGMTGKRRERDDAKEGPKTKGSLSEQRPRNEEEKCAGATLLTRKSNPQPISR